MCKSQSKWAKCRKCQNEISTGFIYSIRFQAFTVSFAEMIVSWVHILCRIINLFQQLRCPELWVIKILATHTHTHTHTCTHTHTYKTQFLPPITSSSSSTTWTKFGHPEDKGSMLLPSIYPGDIMWGSVLVTSITVPPYNFYIFVTQKQKVYCTVQRWSWIQQLLHKNTATKFSTGLISWNTQQFHG